MIDATIEIMWVQAVLQKLHVRSPPSPWLWCDNMGVKYLSSNPIFHGRMKHVKIGYHFVNDRVMKKLLEVRFISRMINLLTILSNHYRMKDSTVFNTFST
jgi:hypothetical protein